MTFTSGRYSWLNIQSSKHLTFYPTWRLNSRAFRAKNQRLPARSVGTSCKRIGYYDVSKGTSLFMIYLRSTPTNQDPDKDQ